MRLRSPMPRRIPVTGLLVAVLMASAAQTAVAQQGRPSAGATGPVGAAPQSATPIPAIATTCFTATEPAAVIIGCDAVLANRRGHTADQIGVALQRRGGARAVLGQVAEAIADFRQMVQANYKPHEAHASIASLQVRDGKLADAEKSFREALRLNPSYGVAHNGLGNTLIALGRPNDSIAHFNQAIATADSDVNAHFGKGLALFASGDLDGSIRSLGDALRLNPRLLPALYQRAQAYADKGDVRNALVDANAVVGIAEGEERVRALAQRGRLHNTAKNYDAAVTDCTEATALADRINARDAQDRASAFVCLALAHQNRGLLTEAQQNYDRALQWVGDDASTHAGRGYVFLQRGRFDEALADFNAALRIDPRSQDALRFLGLTYADKGDNAKALEAFARAIEADAKDPWPLMLRAITFAKSGDRAQALKAVDDAFRLTGQQSSDSFLVRGAVNYFLQDLAAARTDFETAIKLNSENAQAYRLLGRLLVRTGRLDEAGRALDTANRLLPGDSTVLLNNGLLAYSRRDFATAVRDITQSLAINAAHAEGFSVRGQAYEAQGRTELAISDYRSAETKLATDADGKRAQAIARERHAALTRPVPLASTTKVPVAPPSGEQITIGRPATPVPEQTSSRAGGSRPSTDDTTSPRPPPASETDAQRRSAYCLVVEGIFSHSRKYTGVNFDLGCGPNP